MEETFTIINKNFNFTFNKAISIIKNEFKNNNYIKRYNINEKNRRNWGNWRN